MEPSGPIKALQVSLGCIEFPGSWEEEEQE